MAHVTVERARRVDSSLRTLVPIEMEWGVWGNQSSDPPTTRLPRSVNGLLGPNSFQDDRAPGGQADGPSSLTTKQADPASVNPAFPGAEDVCVACVCAVCQVSGRFGGRIPWGGGAPPHGRSSLVQVPNLS